MSDSAGYLCIQRVRALEERGLAQTGPGVLMMHAAQAVAAQAMRMLQGLDPRAAAIALVGPGNNGGDALCALSLLAREGYAVRAFSLVPGRPAAQDAAAVHDRWLEAGWPLESIEQLPDALARCPHPNLLIDGLFGIGLQRPLDARAARIAQLTHRSPSPVLAVDVPSGVDADSGAVVGGIRAGAVRATCTVTLIADKAGLHTGRGLELAGEVVVATLGLETEGVDGLRIDRSWVANRLRVRGAGSHKGSFGSVVVLGGADGMPGAAILAGRAAQAAGAGKVALLGPDGPVFATNAPQLMAWTLHRPAELEQRLATVEATVIGCGLGTGIGARTLFARAIACATPAVLDADGLNLIAQRGVAPDLIPVLRARAGRAPTILTPHPLEAARLLDVEVAIIESDRIAAARRLAAHTGATVLLKGGGSILAAPDGRWALIASGNAALATGGTGDMLAGVIGALLAQGHSAWEAAAMGAWVHGDAADRWRVQYQRGVGLTPDALLAAIVQSINACEPAA